MSIDRGIGRASFRIRGTVRSRGKRRSRIRGWCSSRVRYRGMGWVGLVVVVAIGLVVG